MIEDQSSPRWPLSALACFLCLVVAFDAPAEAITLHTGRLDMMGYAVAYASQWSAGLAGIVTCLLFRRRIMTLGFAWPAWRYGWAGYWIPLSYATLAYALLWITGLAPSQFATYAASAEADFKLGSWSAPISALLVASILVIRALGTCLGEEVGWRGFLVPALAERMTFFPMVLTSGLIWSAWHIPSILGTEYTSAAPAWFTIPCFTVMVIAISGITAWLRLRSGSIWPAVVLHATHNAVIQRLLDPLTVETGRGAWFATEFGVGLALTALLAFAALIQFGGVPATGRQTPKTGLGAQVIAA